MKEPELRPLRKRMQIIFQDPHASLNPAMTIGQSIADPLIIHEAAEEKEAKRAALDIMTEVGLSPAEQLYRKYHADLSGGQKLLAVIARAMILKSVLIGDVARKGARRLPSAGRMPLPSAVPRGHADVRLGGPGLCRFPRTALAVPRDRRRRGRAGSGRGVDVGGPDCEPRSAGRGSERSRRPSADDCNRGPMPDDPNDRRRRRRR